MRDKYLETMPMNNMDGEESWNYHGYDEDDDDLDLNDENEGERPFAPPIFRESSDESKVKKYVSNH